MCPLIGAMSTTFTTPAGRGEQSKSCAFQLVCHSTCPSQLTGFAQGLSNSLHEISHPLEKASIGVKEHVHINALRLAPQSHAACQELIQADKMTAILVQQCEQEFSLRNI